MKVLTYTIFMLNIFVYLAFPQDIFNIMSRKGTISIDANEHKGFDFETGIPKDDFILKTETNSYIALKYLDTIIVVDDNSIIEYKDEHFTVLSGGMYIKSENDGRSEFRFFVDDKYKYNISGKAYSVVNNGDGVELFSYKHGVEIEKDKDIDIKYIMRDRRESNLSLGLTTPKVLSDVYEDKLSSLDNISISSARRYYDKDIKRYKFNIFNGTKYETPVYRVVHKKKGPNVFIIAPHASEKITPIVARNFYDVNIKSGSLTIVPYAVMPAYKKSARYLIEDLNRQFFVYDKNNPVKTEIDKLAKHYMKMFKEYDIDLLLGLHEGNGHDEQFGNAIVYDVKKIDATAKKVIADANSRIDVSEYKFKSFLYPMPSNMSYYASKHGIDAFGIEITRNLPFEIKIRLQTFIIERILKEYKVL